MAVKLNRKAFDHAKKLIRRGKVMMDDRDAWREHQPSAKEENDFIEQHGFGEYSKWHLGIDDEETKTPRKDTNFLTGISRRSTAVQFFPRKAAQDNTSTLTLNARSHIYMA